MSNRRLVKLLRVGRTNKGVLHEPLIPNVAQLFAELDRLNQSAGSRRAGQFKKKSRNQPRTPRRTVFR
jgi:hypothetical protein